MSFFESEPQSPQGTPNRHFRYRKPKLVSEFPRAKIGLLGHKLPQSLKIFLAQGQLPTTLFAGSGDFQETFLPMVLHQLPDKRLAHRKTLRNLRRRFTGLPRFKNTPMNIHRQCCRHDSPPWDLLPLQLQLSYSSIHLSEVCCNITEIIKQIVRIFKDVIRADLAVLEVVVEQHGLLAADTDILRVLRGQPLVLGVSRVCQKNK
ncbi:MAG: hypothetical protein ACKON9_21300 [Planctomycetaceae bacterium]